MTQLVHGRPRPAFLRALGNDEVPPLILCGGQNYRLERVLKHDSWAASGVYRPIGRGQRLKVKFNRTASVGGVPLRWLGNQLARHEAWMLRQLDDLSQTPNWVGEVYVGQQRLRHAVAHEWIPGHPLGKDEKVDEAFFPALYSTLREIHRRGIAYVDLHKRENILVGLDGRPYLIDFQISQALPNCWICRHRLTRQGLRILQQCDLYHLAKHVAHHRPEQLRLFGGVKRPWWITLHRGVAVPFRTLRRRLLVQLGVRTGAGYASSEEFPEDAICQERTTRRQCV
ncbi:MAG: hypothetical protein SNJ75_18290 [Gemmataceae bacterium]